MSCLPAFKMNLTKLLWFVYFFFPNFRRAAKLVILYEASSRDPLPPPLRSRVFTPWKKCPLTNDQTTYGEISACVLAAFHSQCLHWNNFHPFLSISKARENKGDSGFMQVYVAASCENRGRREVDCIIKKVLKTVESFVSRKERERERLTVRSQPYFAYLKCIRHYI